MFGRLFQSARRALSPSLLATGALGASVYAAYQLEWLTVTFDLHLHQLIHVPLKSPRPLFDIDCIMAYCCIENNISELCHQALSLGCKAKRGCHVCRQYLRKQRKQNQKVPSIRTSGGHSRSSRSGQSHMTPRASGIYLTPLSPPP